MKLSLVNDSDNQLPKHWDAMPVGELVYEVQLDPTSTEYKDVEKNAKTSSQNALKQIISVCSDFMLLSSSWLLLKSRLAVRNVALRTSINICNARVNTSNKN